MGCVLDESSTDEAECSGKRVASAIRFLVNARNLQLQCARFLHESFLVPIRMYSSETRIWSGKEGSRIISVKIENYRGLLGIRRMNKLPNTRIKQLCGVAKDVEEKIDEDVLRWFSHVERMMELLRGSMHRVVMGITQWVDQGRDRLIP